MQKEMVETVQSVLDTGDSSGVVGVLPLPFVSQFID